MGSTTYAREERGDHVARREAKAATLARHQQRKTKQEQMGDPGLAMRTTARGVIVPGLNMLGAAVREIGWELAPEPPRRDDAQPAAGSVTLTASGPPAPRRPAPAAAIDSGSRTVPAAPRAGVEGPGGTEAEKTKGACRERSSERARGRRGGRKRSGCGREIKRAEESASALVDALSRRLEDRRLAERKAARLVLAGLAARTDEPWLAPVFAAIAADDPRAVRETARRALRHAAEIAACERDPEQARAACMALALVKWLPVSAIRAARKLEPR